MAAITLTQEQKDLLKVDPLFRKYFVDCIMGDDVGGISYLLRLTSYVEPAQAIAWIVARQIRSNPDIVNNDNMLVEFMTIQMNVRDIDKLEDSVVGSILDQVKSHLNTSNRIGLLVADYFAEKGKNW
jgi:hypothetical protein